MKSPSLFHIDAIVMPVRSAPRLRARAPDSRSPCDARGRLSAQAGWGAAYLTAKRPFPSPAPSSAPRHVRCLRPVHLRSLLVLFRQL